ncbi:TPA: type VI secretion system PAAR protein [Vibrio cholerae]|nr:type VI secretion system PAAR protein [Vibrio cholerae]EJL6287683.1 type VI secretion system PAAR protein [Vibrio cholerae]EKF9373241.1 type VI secretion system PAAR protein [Vibrio cholerae]EKF9801228.1 type VI secretion system PAAR protein [Vibrio cholerae]KAA1223021.1 type VI secretion system PAAR protein [Vibrio cholerae]
MSKGVKVGDIGTDHDGFPPTPVTAGSPDVKFDGQPAARVGDPLAPHDKPKHPPHGRTIAAGSSTVMINGKPAAITGGAVSCGGITIGSGTINIGDTHQPASMSMLSASPRSVSQAQGTASSTVAKNVSPQTLQIPQGSGYWPPYDFTKSKPLDVEYTQKVVDFAVMSLEEAEEFANNLWLEYNGKDTLDNSKKIWDGASNAKDAYQLAKGLGGMGVVAYVKPANGQDYIVIKGYKKHLKTLVKGNRWRANNPQVIQLGLGTKNMARNMLKVGIVVDIAFAIAINAVDVYVHDEKTMEDFVGRSGVDIVKGVVATGAGTIAAVVMATAGAPILVSGLLFAGISVGVGFALDWADNEFGISDSLVDQLKKGE